MNGRAVGAALLSLLLLSGCSAAPPREQPDSLCVSARFQAESGDALQGGAAQFSGEESSHPLDSGGEIRASGLPRSGELLMTLFDQRQEVRGVITLFFGQGAVIDATTDEDGVGHITVRDDTEEVALLFTLTEDGGLTCALRLPRADPPEEAAPRRGA